MRCVAALLFCLAASSPLIAQALAYPFLVGTWFGYGQPDSKDSMYLDHFLANGQLHSQFRDCIKGQALNSTEDGNWSVKGDILTVRITHHDGVPAPRTDTYRLTSVTADRFKDVYIPLNFPFDEMRVEDDFKMPGCQLTS